MTIPLDSLQQLDFHWDQEANSALTPTGCPTENQPVDLAGYFAFLEEVVPRQHLSNRETPGTDDIFRL
jgi:hypothetical protein